MKLMLKRIRDDKGYTQQFVAEQLGVKVATYRTWEQGSVNLTLENAYKISLILNCTPNDLCGWPKGKNEGRTFDDSYEQELVECYRASTQQRKASILQTARDAAGMSREVPESDVPESEVRTA